MNLFVLLLVLSLVVSTIGNVEICFKTQFYESEERSEWLADVHRKLEALFQEKRSINYDYFNLNFSHPAITVEGTMTDGRILTTSPTWRLFSIVPGNIEIFNFTIATTFLNGSYELDGYVGKNRLFDIYGKGHFMMQLNNLSVAAVSSPSLNSSHLCLPLVVKVYVEDCQSNFDNFMNGEVDLDPLLNGVISEIIPDAIRIIFREQADVADPYIQSIINYIFDTKEFFAPLQGTASISYKLYRHLMKIFQ